MTFSEFIRQKRLQTGLSQDAVAQALGYDHRSNIHKLETGKLEWKLSSIFRLAELFNTTTSKLLEEFERSD